MARDVTDARPRKTDSTPDAQRARYEARRRPAKTTADYMDEERRQGVREGRRNAQRVDEERVARARRGAFAAGQANARKEATKPETSAPTVPAPTTATPPAPASPGTPRLTSGGKLAIGAPLAVETVLISVNSFAHDQRPPLPSQLLVAFAFFGLLGLASGDAAGPAAALGWGVVAATFYAGSGAKGKPPAIGAIQTVGDFFGGKYATPGSRPSTAGTDQTTMATTSEAGATALQG
jgi:hypothetical protein